MKTKILIILLGIFLYSCNFAPEFKKPFIPLPSNSTFKIFNATENATSNINWEWWKQFKDPYLNKLIEIGLKNNEDLLIASARIEQALAIARLSKAELYPYFSYKAQIARYRIPEGILGPGAKSRTETFYYLLGSVAYELDLWGKLRNKKKADIARLFAAKAERDALQISLISNIATTYFNLISIEKQIKIAEDFTQKLKEIYEYRVKQYKYGLINELIVKQAKAQYESTKLILEDLKNHREILKSTLAILLGKSPKELFEEDFVTKAELPEAIKIPSMLPSELLVRRPDIVKAEEILKAANFDIGVAKALYFPNINLTGSYGYLSPEFGDLMEHSSSFWNIASVLTGPLFDFGRVKYRVKFQEAKKKEALLQYIKTVKTAFKEVYDALVNISSSREKLKAQEEEIEALKRALELSEKQFKYGIVDYLTVLDAQRNYLRAKLNLVKIKTELINNYIYLYKALGGGWQGLNEKAFDYKISARP